MRRERNEDVKTAKSLYREYKMLQNRLRDDTPEIEKAYTLNMINSVKSRINFSLLESKKKTVEEDEYSRYRA